MKLKHTMLKQIKHTMHTLLYTYILLISLTMTGRSSLKKNQISNNLNAQPAELSHGQELLSEPSADPAQ